MIIHAENICYSYGENAVLNNLTLSVGKGEHIGIIGKSGEGKSTLLKLLSGLYEMQKGILSIDGEGSPTEIRKKVSVVLQGVMLLPGTIRENITCGHIVSESNLNKAIKAARLTEWIDSLPSGIDTEVGESGSKISGGQAQRIAIARAFLKNAPLLLLDEAVSALDEINSNAIIDKLFGDKTRTIISISHHPEGLRHSDRIYRLKEGKLTLC